MIVHTLIYRFDDSVPATTRDEFLGGLRSLAVGSGLVEAFGSGGHHRLPADDHAAGAVGQAIAQFACRDLETLRAFSERDDVHGFLRHWRSAMSYEATYVNHDDLLGAGSATRHCEHGSTVAAPWKIVWDLVADPRRYPDVLPGAREVAVLEESPDHQIVRLTVDAGDAPLSWITRRDLDPANGVMTHRQLDGPPLVGSMCGEWRATADGENTTRLVLTHDFAAGEPDGDGLVEGRLSPAEAGDLLANLVDRNSTAELDALVREAERVHGSGGRPA